MKRENSEFIVDNCSLSGIQTIKITTNNLTKHTSIRSGLYEYENLLNPRYAVPTARRIEKEVTGLNGVEAWMPVEQSFNVRLTSSVEVRHCGLLRKRLYTTHIIFLKENV